MTHFDRWGEDLQWRARCSAQAQREQRRQLVCVAIVVATVATGLAVTYAHAFAAVFSRLDLVMRSFR
jgi:hypothetical protein